jgi:hypothetical protein
VCVFCGRTALKVSKARREARCGILFFRFSPDYEIRDFRFTRFPVSRLRGRFFCFLKFLKKEMRTTRLCASRRFMVSLGQGRSVFKREHGERTVDYPEGKTASLIVFGIPPNTTKEVVMADVEAATGVRPVFFHRLEGKLFAFLHFKNAQDAKHAWNSGFEIAGTSLNVQYAKAREGLDDLEGKTSSLCVFGIPPNTTKEAVIAGVEAETGIRPVFFHRPEGKQFAFLHFKNAKDAKHALNKGFKIARRTVSMQYAKPREGLNDLEGKTSSLQMVGIPPSTTEEAVIADVETQTGVRPVSVDQPNGKQFAFIHFENARNAKHALNKGFKIACKTVSIQYAKPREGLNDVEGKTTSLCVLGIPPNTTAEAVMANVEAETGVKPVMFCQPLGKPFAYIVLKNAEAAKQVLDMGFKFADRTVLIQYAKPSEDLSEATEQARDKGFKVADRTMSITYAKQREELSNLEGKATILCVFGISPSMTEEEVFADVEAQTGVRPVFYQQPESKRFAHIAFKNAKDAKHAFNKGFKIASRIVSITYAPSRKALDFLEGKTSFLHVYGISPSMTEEVVVADVEAQTGIRPVFAMRPEGKQFAFVAFKSADDTKQVLDKGFMIAGRTVAIRYTRLKEVVSYLEDKPTTFLHVCGAPPGATEEEVLGDVEAQTGVKPVFFHQPQVKPYGHIAFKNAKDAKRALNMGFNIAGRTVAVDNANPRKVLSYLEGKATTLCVFDIPPNTTQEALIADVEAETGVKSVFFHQPKGKQVAFIAFKSADDTTQVLDKGFKVAVIDVVIRYTSLKEELLDPEGKASFLVAQARHRRQ